MRFIFLIIILLLGIKIITNKDYMRFYIYTLAIIFIPNAIPLPLDGVHPHRFFAICYILSIIKRNEQHQAKNNSIAYLLFFMFLAHLMTGLCDERLSYISKIWKPLAKFLETFGLLIIGCCTNIKKEEWIYYIYKINKIIILVSLYGLLTLLIQYDPYALLIDNIFDIHTDFYPPFLGGRLRIVSVFYNSHLFAFFSSVWFLINFFLFIKGESNKYTGLCLCFLIINIFISGSRSSLIGTIIGSLLIIVLICKAKYYFKFLLYTLLIAIPLIQIPFIQEKFSSISSIFDSNAEQNGSSLNMREKQLEISLFYWSKNPIWGNGIDYFGENLSENSIETGLYGAESYLFILLIENGSIQICIITLLFLYMTCYFKKRGKYKKENILGLILTINFILVSFITGNPAKWELVLPLIGVILNRNNLNTTYESNKVFFHRPRIQR